MAQLPVLVAGLLFLVKSQASDVADRSTFQGFLSKSDAPRSSMSDYDKFINPNLNRVKHGNGVTKDFNAQTIVDSEEDQAVQKLLPNDSSNPITLSAIGIGLLSLATMLGIRLRVAASQPASSGGLGPLMPMNTASALGDNVMEMKTQDPQVNSSRVGWGQLSSQSSHPLTLCYANNKQAMKRIKISERNRVANAAWRSRVRTWTRKTNEAVEAGDVETARECARVATSTIDRATRRGIYHKNWAARNKSRLSKMVIKLILEKRGGEKPAAAEPAAAEEPVTA
jgi:small subunit ribosomal protein S20